MADHVFEKNEQLYGEQVASQLLIVVRDCVDPVCQDRFRKEHDKKSTKVICQPCARGKSLGKEQFPRAIVTVIEIRLGSVPWQD